MNFSWLSLIGGGFAAAATLTAGISMSGLLTPATPSVAPATDAPVAETIYVEQPIIEIAPITPTVVSSPLPPRIIAILPPETATNTSTTETVSGGAADPTLPQSHETSTSHSSPTPSTVTPSPVLPPSYSDDDGDEAGEDEGGEGGEGDEGDEGGEGGEGE